MLLQFILLAAAAPAAVPTPLPDFEDTAAFGQVASLDERALEQATAREDVAQVARAEQSATVSKSSVSGDVRTGTVSFSDNAFQNLSGLAIINANSGNNVAINAAMNVNVSISPPQ